MTETDKIRIAFALMMVFKFSSKAAFKLLKAGIICATYEYLYWNVHSCIFNRYYREKKKWPVKSFAPYTCILFMSEREREREREREFFD